MPPQGYRYDGDESVDTAPSLVESTEGMAAAPKLRAISRTVPAKARYASMIREGRRGTIVDPSAESSELAELSGDGGWKRTTIPTTTNVNGVHSNTIFLKHRPGHDDDDEYVVLDHQAHARRTTRAHQLRQATKNYSQDVEEEDMQFRLQRRRQEEREKQYLDEQRQMQQDLERERSRERLEEQRRKDARYAQMKQRVLEEKQREKEAYDRWERKQQQSDEDKKVQEEMRKQMELNRRLQEQAEIRRQKLKEAEEERRRKQEEEIMRKQHEVDSQSRKVELQMRIQEEEARQRQLERQKQSKEREAEEERNRQLQLEKQKHQEELQRKKEEERHKMKKPTTAQEKITKRVVIQQHQQELKEQFYSPSTNLYHLPRMKIELFPIPENQQQKLIPAVSYASSTSSSSGSTGSHPQNVNPHEFHCQNDVYYDLGLELDVFPPTFQDDQKHVRPTATKRSPPRMAHSNTRSNNSNKKQDGRVFYC